MINFTERAVPHVSANFLMKEASSRYHFASKFIKGKKYILDMACGTGYGSEIVSNKKSQYIGIDISDEAISFARAHYNDTNVSFIKMDVFNTAFKDSTFDVVLSFEMIEHLDRPKMFLKETVRVLKKGGYVVISTPNSNVQSPDGNLMSPYHTREFNSIELMNMLKPYFDVVEIFGQRKNAIVKRQVEMFMQSQQKRQLLVDLDIFRLRKLVSQEMKEKIWQSVGALFGRNAQESAKVSDFLFTKNNIETAEYLIAVCRKK